MKRFLTAVLAICIATASLTGCSSPPPAATPAPAADAQSSSLPATEPAPASAQDVGTLGVAFRRFDDTHLTNIRNAIEERAAKDGVTVDCVDCQSSQTTINDKVDMFLTKQYKAIGVTIQESSSGSTIIKKAKDAGNVPLVFFTNELFPEDQASYENCYFVGAIASDSGTMQGSIIADYWEANKSTMDRNGDGILQYAMITGDLGTVDALHRTKYSIEELKNRGIQVEEVAQDTAMWDRVKGQEKMQAFLAAHGDKIEAVFANNDDMALGAIEALKGAGYFKDGTNFMPVVGVDATEVGKESIKAGFMLGSVLNDAQKQGDAVMALLTLLAKGEKPTPENYEYPVTPERCVYIPYSPVTAETLQ